MKIRLGLKFKIIIAIESRLRMTVSNELKIGLTILKSHSGHGPSSNLNKDKLQLNSSSVSEPWRT